MVMEVPALKGFLNTFLRSRAAPLGLNALDLNGQPLPLQVTLTTAPAGSALSLSFLTLVLAALLRNFATTFAAIATTAVGCVGVFGPAPPSGELEPLALGVSAGEPVPAGGAGSIDQVAERVVT